jgi:DNA polymerase II small subunit/DNA polymerase delta subunit B
MKQENPSAFDRMSEYSVFNERVRECQSSLREATLLIETIRSRLEELTDSLVESIDISTHHSTQKDLKRRAEEHALKVQGDMVTLEGELLALDTEIGRTRLTIARLKMVDAKYEVHLRDEENQEHFPQA